MPQESFTGTITIALDYLLFVIEVGSNSIEELAMIIIITIICQKSLCSKNEVIWPFPPFHFSEYRCGCEQF